MSRRSPRIALVFVLLVFNLASAPGWADEPVSAPSSEAGFLRGESLRYDEANVFVRLFADIPAIPVSIVTWNATEWATFGAVSLSVGGLMLPLGPPPDQRLDDLVTEHVDPWMPDIWGTPFQVPLWATVAAGGGFTWLVAALRGERQLAESASLAGEALAATQIYHLTLKLSLGREDETGKLRGFPESLSQFPAGTPGGHFATLYSLYGAMEAYWRPRWYVRVFAHTLLAAGALTHFLNHRHLLSDQIWGAAMGYSIGWWVVRNRSTRYEFDPTGEPARLAIVPSGRGIALRGVW